jgi:hypothetical protein
VDGCEDCELDIDFYGKNANYVIWYFYSNAAQSRPHFRTMPRVVEFTDPSTRRWGAKWQQEWPNVSIMSFQGLSTRQRKLLREYIDEEPRTAPENKAFIAGLHAAARPGRPAKD